MKKFSIAPIFRRFSGLWEFLTKPKSAENAEELQRAGLLNSALLVLMLLGIIGESEYVLRSGSFGATDVFVIGGITLLGFAYGFNRAGYFTPAIVVTLGVFITGTFAAWLTQSDRKDTSILFYLLVPFLMAEFFLSLRGYVATSILILAGLLGTFSGNPQVIDIFLFFLIFSSLMGVASYYRQRIERRKRASLRESEERYRLLFESNPHPMWVYDLETLVFLTVNDAAVRDYGYTREEFLSMSIRDIHFIETAPDTMDSLHHSPEELGGSGIWRHVRKDGAVFLAEINSHPMTFFNRQAKLVLAQDITERIRAEEIQQTLLNTERQHARRMELLNSITHASLETVAFKDMLQMLADQLGGLLEADGAFITLWDDVQGKPIPAAAYGEMRDMYPLLRFDPDKSTLTESVLRDGRPLALDDVTNASELCQDIASDFLSTSVLTLPLIAHEQKLGAALITFNRSHQFTVQEIAVGEQAAAQIALALNRAKLLDDISHRMVQLSLLQEVSRRIATGLDEKEILQRTVEAMVDIFGYAEAAISLPVENDQLEMVVITGTEDMGLGPGFRQNMGQGIIGHVAETLEPYFTGDIANDPYYYHPNGKRNGSAMAVPLVHEGRLLGVIYVESVNRNAVVQDDLQTMQTLASNLVTAIQKARLYANTRDHLTAMTTLQSVTETATSSLELERVFDILVQLLKENFGYGFVSIYLLEGKRLLLGAQAGYSEELIIREIPITQGVTGRTVRTREVQFVRDVEADPDFLRASPEVESEICVPLLKEDTVLGIIDIESASNRPLTEKDKELLTAIAGPIAIAIDNARLHAEVKSLAMTDSLSGLFNRRTFDQMLETEIARAKRYGLPLSLIIFDLDSFKEYNDTWGHPAGDQCIRNTAGLLRASLRHHDIAARYGGDEFAIVLPNIDKEGAMMLAERLRASAESEAPDPQIHRKAKPVRTLSIGVATFPKDGNTAASLILAADNAELAAKRLGKNRVCAAGRSEEPAL